MEYNKILNSNRTGYVNEEERNVHIWCSQFGIGGARKPGLVLFAGFYNHNGVTMKMLYHWVRIIDRTGQKFILVSGLDPRLIISKDNTIENISYQTLSQQGETKIFGQEDETIVNGHYYVFSTNRKELLLRSPELHNGNKTGLLVPGQEIKRVRSSLLKAMKVNDHMYQSSIFRKAIRMRDKKCVLTQRIVPFRDRVPDFTSFQAAHIYPFSLLTVNSYQKFLDPSNRSIFRNPQLGDGKPNGILLFSNLHLLYDAHAVGILVDESGQIPIYKTYCFEKSNIDLVDKYPELKFNDQVEHPMANFFWEQFKLCLLASFAGNGRVFTT